MTDQTAGVCPVCNVEIMRPWRYSAQAFGGQTLIHFSCLATWNRVIGAWHTEIAFVEHEQADKIEELEAEIRRLRDIEDAAIG